MSQKIDPTGFPKGVWGLVLDYTAPSTQETLIYRVNNRPPAYFDLALNLQGALWEGVWFNWSQIVQPINDYSEFGQYYELPKVDQQIRVFAMRTFVVGFGGKSARDQKMNLRDSVISLLNTCNESFGIRPLYTILQRIGLIGERAVDRSNLHPVGFDFSQIADVQYFALPQPDEPKETITLEESDVTVEDVTPPQS